LPAIAFLRSTAPHDDWLDCASLLGRRLALHHRAAPAAPEPTELRTVPSPDGVGVTEARVPVMVTDTAAYVREHPEAFAQAAQGTPSAKVDVLRLFLDAERRTTLPLEDLFRDHEGRLPWRGERSRW
jgi:hypothetical protein